MAQRTTEDSVLGDWVIDLSGLSQSDCTQFIIVDNFLSERYLDAAREEFGRGLEEWWKYMNPIEVKYAYDKFSCMGQDTQKIFTELGSEAVTSRLGSLFNMPGLETDPYLHGSGLHCHPRNGRLAIHLDYERHPRLPNKQRALNIILYLNREWKEQWNGDTQLWSHDLKQCVIRSFPKPNRAIIFKTNETSWHGVPERILCPDGYYRKTLAFYYLLPLSSTSDMAKVGAGSAGYRDKATFVQRPQDPPDERIERLLAMRPYRRITDKDMQEIWPDWTTDT